MRVPIKTDEAYAVHVPIYSNSNMARTHSSAGPGNNNHIKNL